MITKMKKSQLKEAVKAVVRECLNERLKKEGCGSGKKRFTGKAGRMFKHVEDSEKEQGKSTKVAKKIAGATVNKKLKEQVGADVVAGENMGADSKQTPMDDIVKFVIRKVPAIASNPQKVARVADLLFQKQYGGQPADPDTLLTIVQKHMKAVPNAPGGEDQSECGSMQDEAGLTSETGEEAAMMPVGNMPGGEEGGEGYDEKEEIMLIKVMALIAKKLEAMHAGMPGDEADPAAACPAASEEEPSEEPSAPPFGGGEEEPEEKPEPEEPSEPKDDKKKEKKKEPPLKEGSAKTQTQGYRVAPNPSTLTQKTDDEKEKPTDPRLTETDVHMKMGPQYKTVAPRQARVTSDDQARTIQFDPKMTEAAKKKMKENHKVQVRSAKTVNDMDNDPNNVRDPEIPQA